MSERGAYHPLLSATTPATATTALPVFESRGNTITLYISTVTGGAGICTFTIESSHDNSTWYVITDFETGSTSWQIDVNTAGNFELTLPISILPRNHYRVSYSCENAAGTIAISALSWENTGKFGKSQASGYVSASDATKVIVQPPDDVPETLVDGPLAVGTHSYPSSDGWSNDGFQGPISIHLYLDAPAGCTINCRIKAFNDPDAVRVFNVTEMAYLSDGTTLNATVLCSAGTTVDIGLVLPDYIQAYNKMFLEVVVAGVAADNVSAWLFRKEMK